MSDSNIPYCDVTWNPVTGCTPCSPGCKHCWAAAMARRFPNVHAKAGSYNLGPGFPVPVPFSQTVLHPDRLDEPLRWRKPRVVGVCMMGDLYHEQVDEEFRDDVFRVIARTPHHTFLVLTKRPETLLSYMGAWSLASWLSRTDGKAFSWPNLWLGVTVCTRSELSKVDVLREWPAAHRWVSFEPLLEDLGEVSLGGIEQVILGCESGTGRRPAPHEWFERIERQCQAAGVPLYIKQISRNLDGNGRLDHYAPEAGELAWRKEAGAAKDAKQRGRKAA